MNIAICDDEKECQNDVEKHLKLYFADKQISIDIFKFDSASELIKSDMPYDIAFLDVELGDGSGISVGAELKKKNNQIIIFIVTAYEKYIDDAFQLKAFRCLPKPIETDRLYSSLDKAIESLNNNYIEFIDCNAKERIRLSYKEIVYLEITNRKTKIVTINNVFYSKEKLNVWKNKLNATYFVSPHSSYIINMNYTREFSRTTVNLKYNDKSVIIPVAAKNQSAFRQIYFSFQTEGC